MSRIFKYVPKTVNVIINDKSFDIKPFSLADIAKVESIIAKNYTNPLQDVVNNIHKFAPEIRREILSEYAKHKPASIFSSEGTSPTESVAQGKAMTYVILSNADKSVTEAYIDELFSQMTFQETQDFITYITSIGLGLDDVELSPEDFEEAKKDADPKE